MNEPHIPSAHDNFEGWLDAYAYTHPRNDGVYTLDDMFAAWVGGAIFATNKFFNPQLPPRILPDIFRATDEPDHG